VLGEMKSLDDARRDAARARCIAHATKAMNDALEAGWHDLDDLRSAPMLAPIRASEQWQRIERRCAEINAGG
jgi:hypothetical protein